MSGGGEPRSSGQSRGREDSQETQANARRWIRDAWSGCWKSLSGPDGGPEILVLDAFGGEYAVGIPCGQDNVPEPGSGTRPGPRYDKEVETDD